MYLHLTQARAIFLFTFCHTPPRFHIQPHSELEIRERCIGFESSATNSSKCRGYISSGPHDLFKLNLIISLYMSSVIRMSKILAKIPSGSWVKAVEN